MGSSLQGSDLLAEEPPSGLGAGAFGEEEPTVDDEGGGELTVEEVFCVGDGGGVLFGDGLVACGAFL